MMRNTLATCTLALTLIGRTVDASPEPTLPTGAATQAAGEIRQPTNKDRQDDARSKSTYTIRYAKRERSHYRSLEISRNGKVTILLNSPRWLFDGSPYPNEISPDGEMAVIGMLDTGTAAGDDGGHEQRERFYCTFISLPDGCVLDSGTGEECGGDWAAEGWRRPDGSEWNVRATVSRT